MRYSALLTLSRKNHRPAHLRSHRSWACYRWCCPSPDIDAGLREAALVLSTTPLPFASLKTTPVTESPLVGSALS